MKPCPFCGSDDVGYGYRTRPDGRELAMISCSNCGANGPTRTYASQWDDDEAEASWDKRHNAQAHRKNRRSEAKAGFSGAAPCWADSLWELNRTEKF